MGNMTNEHENFYINMTGIIVISPKFLNFADVIYPGIKPIKKGFIT